MPDNVFRIMTESDGLTSYSTAAGS